MQELWRNQTIAAVMKIFLILMAMDIFYRAYLFPKVMGGAEAAQEQNPIGDDMGSSINGAERQPMSGINIQNEDGSSDGLRITRQNDQGSDFLGDNGDDFMAGQTATNNRNLDGMDAPAPGPSRLVHIQFCMGCQYNGQFNAMKEELEMMQIATVTGSNYPLNTMRYVLSWVVSILQWAVIIMMMQGESVFQYFGITPPPLYYRMQEKKWMVLIGAFLLGNQLSSMVTNTGAFEVYCDGQLIFSKLGTNQMPDPRVLAGLIKNM